jgi:hypothetical protein
MLPAHAVEGGLLLDTSYLHVEYVVSKGPGRCTTAVVMIEGNWFGA